MSSFHEGERYAFLCSTKAPILDKNFLTRNFKTAKDRTARRGGLLARLLSPLSSVALAAKGRK